MLEHLSLGPGHLEVDISGGPLKDSLLCQRQSVAGVDTVLFTPAVNTHLEIENSGENYVSSSSSFDLNDCLGISMWHCGMD